MGEVLIVKELAAVIFSVIFLGAWCYGMARAESNWKYIPVIGTLVGGVCIMEDYAIPKSP